MFLGLLDPDPEHWSEACIRGSRSGSGYTSKCYGSATLPETCHLIFIFWPTVQQIMEYKSQTDLFCIRNAFQLQFRFRFRWGKKLQFLRFSSTTLTEIMCKFYIGPSKIYLVRLLLWQCSAVDKGEVFHTTDHSRKESRKSTNKNINLRVRTPGHEEELLLLARLRSSLTNKKIIT